MPPALTRRCQRYLLLISCVTIVVCLIIYAHSVSYEESFRFLATIRPARVISRARINKTIVVSSKNRNRRSKLFPVVRKNKTARRFVSSAVENLIEHIASSIDNAELAWLFRNCFPNTLDTTVEFELRTTSTGQVPDTYVITGDIDAMWLRDSSAQVHPYLPLMRDDQRLRQLIEGVLLRQLMFIQRDPYANAHYKDTNRTSEWKQMDLTDMRPGVHERKWELDSLCYVLRLMYSYWTEVDHDLTFFRLNQDQFKKTIRIILRTMREQQRFAGSGNQYETLCTRQSHFD
jgi:uncharacterized protein